MATATEQRISHVLKRAQHALRNATDEALRQRGVTTAQYTALSALEASPALSGAELARRSFVTPQTMQEIVANLEAAGHVARKRDVDDARILLTHLTDQGRSMVVACHETVKGVEERMLTDLGKKERRRLSDALTRCTTALEAAGDRSGKK